MTEAVLCCGFLFVAFVVVFWNMVRLDAENMSLKGRVGILKAALGLDDD